ncbi:MAG: phospholipase D-like domain-containing protein [Planctomycetota bacterium]
MRSPLLALSLVAALGTAALAQEEDVLVLEKGVLELPNQAGPKEKALYANAYFSPYESLDQRVIAALNLAKPGSVVYMSYYSISYAEYPKMFRKLKEKGVTLRLNLYEKEAVPSTKTMDDELIADGFDVALIPNLRNANGQGSMHTKFTVVNDEIIVTGSANLSASASLANHEHVIVVQEKTLAKRYIEEFKEQRAAAQAMHDAMTPEELESFNESYQDPFPADWDSSGRAEDLRKALVKIDRKTRNYNKRVQGWFSPEDALDGRVSEQLRKAQKTIHVAMYTFVNSLVNDLVDAARRGVQVTVVADDHQQAMESAEWVNQKLEAEPNIRYIRANNHLGLYSAIHHKYAVIDGEVVCGGSYNWTGNATRYNDENLMVLRGRKVAQRFEKDFASMLAEYDPDGPRIEFDREGQGGRLLFAVKLPFEVPRNLEVQVVITDAAGKARAVELRNSRSTGENWLGSTDVTSGEAMTWSVRIGDSKGLSGALQGEEAKLFVEAGEPRKLIAPAGGVPLIVHDAWKGDAPKFD